MAVRLRLSRIGKKHAPIFRVVAVDSRKKRDSDYLENLGTYNPMTDEYVQFHVERIEAWFEKGALPTDSVKKLYRRFKKAQKAQQPQEVVSDERSAQGDVSVDSESVVDKKVVKTSSRKTTPKDVVEKKSAVKSEQVEQDAAVDATQDV
jgi:small subunit ribosomal protein S16